MSKPTNISSLFAVSLATLGIVGCAAKQTNNHVVSQAEWHQATNQVHQRYADEVENRLKPYFTQANIAYPPQEIAMLTFKNQKMIELWAKDNQQSWQHIKNYPLTAYSGKLGPKLKRNDGQIPEGIYKITHFNPYSSQHLSLMLNYPNQFDRQWARYDGRQDLGDNIFIHGKAKSVGCLAIGNQAIDDIFVLVKEVGKENTKIIIAPNDLRKTSPIANKNTSPQWLPKLYQKLASELSQYS